MPGRNASTVSREIRRNTWFPSDENESYRPKRLKTAPWTGGYYIAGPAQRKAERRRGNGCATLMNRSSMMPYLGIHIRQLSRKT